MTDEVTRYESKPDDGGFDGSINTGRLLRGTFLKWNDTTSWRDRDDLPPPSPMLVVGINTALQRWQDHKATTIVDKPLPDIETLNASIPVTEWELGLNNERRPPWQFVVIVYLVNLATGEFFTFLSATTGARIAYDHLKEAVVTMRALRGAQVLPMVNLSTRPMKTKFGPRSRPHFEIIGWRTPGDGGGTLPSDKPPPQLAGPTTAPATSTAAATPAANFATETADVMGKVKRVTLEELLNDAIPI